MQYLIFINGCLNDNWILDTTCTSHTSHKRDCFINYELVNGGSVLMENDVACKIIGIDAVRIKA